MTTKHVYAVVLHGRGCSVSIPACFTDMAAANAAKYWVERRPISYNDERTVIAAQVFGSFDAYLEAHPDIQERWRKEQRAKAIRAAVVARLTPEEREAFGFLPPEAERNA